MDMALIQRQRVSAASCTRERRANPILHAEGAEIEQVAVMAETKAAMTVEAEAEAAVVEPAKGMAEEAFED